MQALSRFASFLAIAWLLAAIVNLIRLFRKLVSAVSRQFRTIMARPWTVVLYICLSRSRLSAFKYALLIFEKAMRMLWTTANNENSWIPGNHAMDESTRALYIPLSWFPCITSLHWGFEFPTSPPILIWKKGWDEMTFASRGILSTSTFSNSCVYVY